MCSAQTDGEMARMTTTSSLPVVTYTILFLLLTAADEASHHSRPSPGRYDYCVVGAGPGGLQVASMLVEAGKDASSNISVVVFDKAPRAGSFFSTFLSISNVFQ